MKDVTENEELAKNLHPEDRAVIIKAVLDQVTSYIKSSSSVQSVSSLEVRKRANQIIRGMTLFGSHSGMEGDEILAVKVFKWSPGSANFAAETEALNNQKAHMPKSGEHAQNSSQGSTGKRPFISHADDF